MPPPAACTASASRSSMPCPHPPWWRSPATRNCSARASPRDYRKGRSKRSAARPTGAAHRSPSPPTQRSSANRNSSPPASTASPGPRPISSLGSKSAGNARPNSSATIRRPKPSSSSPAASPIISRNRSATANAPPASSFRAIRIFPATPAGSNGLSLGHSGRTAATAGIATPSPRPMAAPMKRACAPRWSRVSAPLAIWSGRKRRRTSPPTTS